MLHLGKEGFGRATCLPWAAELGRDEVDSSDLPSSSGFFRLAGKVEKELAKVFLVGRGQEFFKVPIFKQQGANSLGQFVVNAVKRIQPRRKDVVVRLIETPRFYGWCHFRWECLLMWCMRCHALWKCCHYWMECEWLRLGIVHVRMRGHSTLEGQLEFKQLGDGHGWLGLSYFGCEATPNLGFHLNSSILCCSLSFFSNSSTCCKRISWSVYRVIIVMRVSVLLVFWEMKLVLSLCGCLFPVRRVPILAKLLGLLCGCCGRSRLPHCKLWGYTVFSSGWKTDTTDTAVRTWGWHGLIADARPLQIGLPVGVLRSWETDTEVASWCLSVGRNVSLGWRNGHSHGIWLVMGGNKAFSELTWWCRIGRGKVSSEQTPRVRDVHHGPFFGPQNCTVPWPPNII